MKILVVCDQLKKCLPKHLELWRITAFSFAVALGPALADETTDTTNAWKVLNAIATGDVGKKTALELLYLAEEDLTNIDLSCVTMKGGWNEQEFTCDKPVQMRNLFVFEGISKTDLSQVQTDEIVLNLSNADFSGTNLEASQFKNALLYGAVFVGANLESTDFEGATLIDVNFAYANLTNANLSYSSVVHANFTGTTLFETNISGVEFCGEGITPSECANGLTQDQIDSSWAWDDRPPTFNHWEGDYFLALEMPSFCSASLRDDYEAMDRTDKPC